MKRYSSYKSTGIQWLPEIPSHWEVLRFGSLFKRKPAINKPEEELLSVFLDRGVIKASDSDKRTHQASEDLSKYQLVEPSDFVMNNQQAWRGSVGVSDYTGIISPAYHIFPMPSCYDYHYANYLLRERVMVNLFDISSKGVGSIQRTLNFNWLNNGKCLLPPIEEQRQIVAYLDKQLTLIETCKCQRERELQTLNELKQAEIASVVTRGLNPNVPMKDSGQIQFGEIPAHWDSVKMKYCFTQRSEKGFPNEPVLCATQSKGVIPQSLYENRVVVVNKGFEGLKLVKVGDFVISLRSFQGGIEYAYYQGIISAAYTILTPKDERNSQYFKYLFKSHPFIQLLQTCVTGIREGQNINYAVLGNNFIPIPPIEEQNAIVEYIEAKTNNIDTMIDALKAEIDRLTEYKQRLISDVVTGQINVQNEQV